MDRVLLSAPVAVIVTVAALVVFQVNVTAWPEAMLLLLAEKTRVGPDVTVTGGLAEAEPQPVKAISVEIAANPNRIFELLLRILLPPLVWAACNVFLLKRGSSKANIPTTTVLRPISIPFRFPINVSRQALRLEISYSDSHLLL
jgi:hypothetical protein